MHYDKFKPGKVYKSPDWHLLCLEVDPKKKKAFFIQVIGRKPDLYKGKALRLSDVVDAPTPWEKAFEVVLMDCYGWADTRRMGVIEKMRIVSAKQGYPLFSVGVVKTLRSLFMKKTSLREFGD